MFIDNQKILSLLPMSECIQVMKELFMLDFEKDLINPLRSKLVLDNPQKGIMGMMPAYIKPLEVMGIKILSVFPENYKKGLSSHQGILHLFETKTGRLIGSFDADEITAIRTAAVSALATDLLADKNAKNLCLIGSGKQARKHLEAMLLVRPIQRISIWGNNVQNAERFAKEAKELSELPVQVCASVEKAARDADIICTVTAAQEPILENHYLKPNVHVNAVGACTPNIRELSTDVIKAAKVYVDNYESAINESGALIMAAKEDKCNPDDFIDHTISRILRDPTLIEQSSKTVFKSLGLAVEDVACGHYVLQKLGENAI